MKKYKINRAYPVNTRASKNGVKWEYGGKKTAEEVEELKEYFEAGHCAMIGLRITDTETDTVIYEKII